MCAPLCMIERSAPPFTWFVLSVKDSCVSSPAEFMRRAAEANESARCKKLGKRCRKWAGHPGAHRTRVEESEGGF